MGIESLFSPIKIKNLNFKNRFCMAPMSRYSCPGCVPNEELKEYYRRRAKNDVALIFTGGAGVDRPASNNSRVLADFRPACYSEWKKCVDAVHEENGYIALQLWHAGAWFKTEPEFHPEGIESPSGYGAPGWQLGRAMSECDIAETIHEFGKAAQAAISMGFDAIEIHAAHGYLLDQFFWSETNKRHDRWGGPNIDDRLEFCIATIREVRKVIGPDYLLSIRISQWKEQKYDARIADSPEELERWVGPIADAGVDVIHCSQRRFWEPEFEGSDMNLSAWVKKITGKHVITTGSVGLDTDIISFFSGTVVHSTNLDNLIARFERGDFDLVSVGRSLLADPEWVMKVKEGKYQLIQPFDKSKVDLVY